MTATNVQPDNAKLIFSLSLLTDKRTFWLLQIAGVIFFCVFGWFFVWFTAQIRITLFQAGFLEGIGALLGNSSIIQFLLIVLGPMIVFILVHELIHGAFFWIFSHSRPIFGLRSGYAYAAAPGWYFPRRQYLIIALAPLVLISILGMALVALVPAGAIVAILVGVVANAAGSVGDIWIAFLVIREPSKIVIEDLGDGFNIYKLG